MVRRSWKSLLAGVALVGGLAVPGTVFAGEIMTAKSMDQRFQQIFAESSSPVAIRLVSDCCSDTGSCCAPAGCCDDACGDADGCCEIGCGEGCADFGCDEGCGITFGGWTQFGYQNGPDGAFTGNGAFNNVNFGGGFNNATEWNKFNLNQQGVYVGKVADGSEGLGWGFRAELIYGVDGNEAQSFGNNPGNYDFVNGWDHGIYEWALPQLYSEVALGDLSVKVGHFYTPIGYEVIPSGGNFFLSRQLTFYNSEPFTHTGALGTYTASDELQVLGGWTLGMDTGFDRFNNGSSFIGGFIYKLSEETSLTYMMTAGELGVRGNGAINSIFVTQSWSDKISSVHQFDALGSNLGGDFATTGIADNSTGQINYLFYQISDKTKAGVRQEWYKADGTSYNTLTGGVNITPIENLVIRPELRYMWAPGANNSALAPGHADLFNQTVFGIDAIVTY